MIMEAIVKRCGTSNHVMLGKLDVKDGDTVYVFKDRDTETALAKLSKDLRRMEANTLCRAEIGSILDWISEKMESIDSELKFIRNEIKSRSLQQS
jgi:hypothetical protein